MIKDMEYKRKVLLAGCFSGLLNGCGGTSPNGLPITPNSGKYSPNCNVTAGQNTSSTYTISWNAVDPTDLSGYKIYYGTTFPFSKYNALGIIDVGNTTMVTFKPSDYNIKTCILAYIGVTAIGTKPESALSNIEEIVVE